MEAVTGRSTRPYLQVTVMPVPGMSALSALPVTLPIMTGKLARLLENYPACLIQKDQVARTVPTINGYAQPEVATAESVNLSGAPLGGFY